MRRALDVQAAVTTAGDVRFGVALDQPPDGYVLVNPENAKTVMAALVGGAKAKLTGKADWLEASGIPFADDGAVEIVVSEKCGR